MKYCLLLCVLLVLFVLYFRYNTIEYSKSICPDLRCPSDTSTSTGKCQCVHYSYMNNRGTAVDELKKQCVSASQMANKEKRRCLWSDTNFTCVFDDKNECVDSKCTCDVDKLLGGSLISLSKYKDYFEPATDCKEEENKCQLIQQSQSGGLNSNVYTVLENNLSTINETNREILINVSNALNSIETMMCINGLISSPVVNAVGDAEGVGEVFDVGLGIDCSAVVTDAFAMAQCLTDDPATEIENKLEGDEDHQLRNLLLLYKCSKYLP